MKEVIFNKKISSVHFIGVGGISTSALASYLLSKGFIVSGSDNVKSNLTENLKRSGAKIYYGHKENNVLGADAIIYTSAVLADNPELIKAQKEGIPCFKRSELLGEIASKFNRSIAVSGSHGKTTATGMISDVLIKAKIDPTVFIGGEHSEFNNCRLGGSDTVVIEACEYKKNFLDLKPTVSVILNVDNDHMDSYKDEKDMVAAFGQFAKDSITLVNADDINASKIFNSTTVTFGVQNKATYTAKRVKFNGKGYSFTAYAYGRALGRINLNVSGVHNVYNAIAAVAVADILGVRFSFIKSGLENFCGIKRRNEYLGDKDGLKVYADYAHHPKEILAMLNSYREQGENFITVFQPHTYSRTRILMEDFLSVLKDVSPLIIYKTYSAREEFDVRGDAKTLYERLKEVSTGKVYYIKTIKELSLAIEKEKTGKDRIIFLGAGDIYQIAKGQIN